MRQLTIYLGDNHTLCDWMRKEIAGRRSNRYKLTHMAEDMKVPYSQLYNFTIGKNVTTTFVDKFFLLYLRSWNS